MIQSKCNVPFTPIEVSQGLSGWLGTEEGGRAGGPGAQGSTPVALVSSCSFIMKTHGPSFLLRIPVPASALKAVNYKILDQENRRVCVKKGPGRGFVCRALGLGPGAEPSVEVTLPLCVPCRYPSSSTRHLRPIQY